MEGLYVFSLVVSLVSLSCSLPINEELIELSRNINAEIGKDNTDGKAFFRLPGIKDDVIENWEEENESGKGHENLFKNGKTISRVIDNYSGDRKEFEHKKFHFLFIRGEGGDDSDNTEELENETLDNEFGEENVEGINVQYEQLGNEYGEINNIDEDDDFEDNGEEESDVVSEEDEQDETDDKLYEVEIYDVDENSEMDYDHDEVEDLEGHVNSLEDTLEDLSDNAEENYNNEYVVNADQVQDDDQDEYENNQDSNEYGDEEEKENGEDSMVEDNKYNGNEVTSETENVDDDRDNSEEGLSDESFGVLDYLENMKWKGEGDKDDRKLYEEIDEKDAAKMDYIEDYNDDSEYDD